LFLFICYDDFGQNMVEIHVSPDAIVERVLSAGQPEKIILFGSHARDSAHAHSDYDLLIVQPSDLPRPARSGVYYRALSDLPVEIDVVVVTPEEIRDWEHVPQAFVTTALREGKTLYERQA
jgi:predicted nucleotidyltransferase